MRCSKVSIEFVWVHNLQFTFSDGFCLFEKYFRLLCPVMACIRMVKFIGESLSICLLLLGCICGKKTFVCLAKLESNIHLFCQQL